MTFYGVFFISNTCHFYLYNYKVSHFALYILALNFRFDSSYILLQLQRREDHADGTCLSHKHSRQMPSALLVPERLQATNVLPQQAIVECQ